MKGRIMMFVCKRVLVFVVVVVVVVFVLIGCVDIGSGLGGFGFGGDGGFDNLVIIFLFKNFGNLYFDIFSEGGKKVVEEFSGMFVEVGFVEVIFDV